MSIIKTEIYNFKAVVNNYKYSHKEYTVLYDQTYIFMVKTIDGETISFEMKNIHLLEQIVSSGSLLNYSINTFHIYDLFEYMYNCDINPNNKTEDDIALIWNIANDIYKNINQKNIKKPDLQNIFSLSIACVYNDNVYPHIIVDKKIVDMTSVIDVVKDKMQKKLYDLSDGHLLKKILE